MPYSYDRTAVQSLAPLLKKISDGVFDVLTDFDRKLDPRVPPQGLNAKTWVALLQQGLLTEGLKVRDRVTVALSAKGQAELAALTDKHRGKVVYESGREGYNLIIDVTVDRRRIGRWERELPGRAIKDRGITYKILPNIAWEFAVQTDDPELSGLLPPQKFEGERLPAAAKKWLEGELRRRGVIG